MNAIEIALDDPRGGQHPSADLEVFPGSRRRRDDPGRVPAVAASRTTWRPASTWADVVQAMREDEFCLDPTRMTLVCGTAGFDGTQFKGLLAERLQHPAQQDLAQLACCCSPTSTTRAATSRTSIRVLVEICREIEKRLAATAATARRPLRGPRQER